MSLVMDIFEYLEVDYLLISSLYNLICGVNDDFNLGIEMGVPFSIVHDLNLTK